MMPSVFGRKDPWPGVINKAASSVAMLTMTRTRAFDGEMPSTVVGSGFVVDKLRGIILTTAAVCSRGPATGKALFPTNEEADVRLIYVDPEHDFAFVKYDSRELTYVEINEAVIYPEGAKVGVEIRVIGSDAGERLMVLDGTISDCKRPMLEFGGDAGAGDMNIFYITASSGVTGGSAGAPVLDSRGRVVAMNTGGVEDAASSFFIPLTRVVRALKLFQKGDEHIPRGTIQTIFDYENIDELVRLGLPKHEQLALRKANAHRDGSASTIGGLTVLRMNDQCPAHDANVRTGDILLRVNGKTVVHYLDLETILDDNTGKDVSFEFQRGEELVKCQIRVQDMNKDFPKSEFIEYSDGIIQPLSYSQAVAWQVPVGSVYVSSAGYSMKRAIRLDQAVITEIGDQPIANLDDFEKAICTLHDGEKVSFRTFPIERKHIDKVSIVTIDRKWFPMRRFSWNFKKLQWDRRNCPMPSKPAPNLRRPSMILNRRASFSHFEYRANDPEHVRSALRSLVYIDSASPYGTNGFVTGATSGIGVVVDAERGLVLCDQVAAPSQIMDLSLVIASTFEIPCKVIFTHPTHNFVFLKYDPTLMGAVELKALPLFNSTEQPGKELKRGDLLDFCGLTVQRRFTTEFQVKVTGFETDSTTSSNFSDRGFVRIDLNSKLASALAGVFVDETGTARAIMSQFQGINGRAVFTTLIALNLKRLQRALDAKQTPLSVNCGCFPVDFAPIPLSDARNDYGLEETWTRKLAQASDADVHGPALGAREVLKVVHSMSGTDLHLQLRGGDLLLEVDHQSIVNIFQLDLCANTALEEGMRPMKVTILRDKQLLELEILPAELKACGSMNRLVEFAGMHCLDTPFSFMNGPVPSFLHPSRDRGVFISATKAGSPAEASGFAPGCFIIGIDSKDVHTLQDLVDAIKECRQGDAVRVGVFYQDDSDSVETLEMDLHYWPTHDLRLDEATGEWELFTVQPSEQQLALQ